MNRRCPEYRKKRDRAIAERLKAWMLFVPPPVAAVAVAETKKKPFPTTKKKRRLQVARALVHLHSELLSGRTHALESLMALPELMPLGNSLRELVDRDGSVVATTTAARAARRGGDGDGESSSSGDDDDEMSEGEQGAAAAAAMAQAPRFSKAAPQIDEDGFQTVVRGGGGRRK